MENSIPNNAVAYLTIGDNISQKLMNGYSPEQKLLRLKRNLKIALLSHDKVIIRATAALKSPLTRLLFVPDNGLNFDSVECLLKDGCLVPEVRQEGEEKFNDLEFLEKTIKLDRDQIKNIRPVADLLDETSTRHIVDEGFLSDCRTNAFINQVFRLYFHQKNLDQELHWIKPSVTIEKIDQVFKENLPIGEKPAREDFMNPIGELFTHDEYSFHVFQNIYFLKGAELAGANPLWTKEIDPTIKYSGMWSCQYPLNTSIYNNIGEKGRKIIEDRGFTELARTYQSINFTTEDIEMNENEEHLNSYWFTLNLTDEELDKLSFKKILEIRATKEWVSYLHQLLLTKNIRDSYEKEVEMVDKRNIYFAIGAAVTGVAASIFTLIPDIAFYSTLFGLGASAIPIRKNKHPLHSFSEFIHKEKYIKL